MADDPFVYPGTNVLRNKKGLRDPARLEQLEAQATTMRIAGLESAPIQGSFDLDHLKAVHRHIFQDVYPWAGQLREGTGIMTKERLGARVIYGNSDHVAAEAARLLRLLQRENRLQGLGAPAFAGRLAFYYSELDAVHPFREGNSRTLRAFTAQIAQQAGHTLDWSAVGQSEDARNALYRARDAGVMAGVTGPLETLVTQALTPRKNAAATIADAMRSSGPASPKPWEPPPVPMAERVRTFEERLKADKGPASKAEEKPGPEPDDRPKPRSGPKP